MKRIIIILYILANCPMLFAQSAMSQLYKQWMIEDINSNKFEKAKQEIIHIEDWTFNDADDKAYVDIDKALTFAEYLTSLGMSDALRDSLLLYVADESYVLSYYMQLDGKYKDAIPYAELELKIRKSVLGEHNLDYIAALHNLGLLYRMAGDYSMAEMYFRQKIDLQKSILGENNLDCASSLNTLGTLYYDIGDYTQAEEFLLNALMIRKNLAANQPVCASTLNNLGNLYHQICDYAKAKECYLDALAIYQNAFGENHLSCAGTLNNLGNLYFDNDDLEKAEKCYTQVLEMRKSILGENNPDYATSLNNLGNLYRKMGDDQKAEKFHIRALEIRESIFGKHHHDYAMSLFNLGGIYRKNGEYDKAEKFYLQALEIEKKVWGENHPHCASIFNNLGLLYCVIRDYGKAADCYLQSLEINKKIFGENHVNYAKNRNNLGEIYDIIGEHQLAERCYLQSADIKKNILGENNSDYARSLNNLGHHYFDLGEYKKTEPCYIKAQSIINESFLQSVEFMSENQRNLYWEAIKREYQYNYPLFAYRYHIKKPDISTFAYNNELFTKGLLLASSENIRRSIFESGDTCLIKKWNELTSKKQQITILEDKDPLSENLKQLKEETEIHEKEITKSSAAFRQSKEQWNISWDSVRNHLGNNQVAVEYMVAPLNKDSTMYCALLLRNNSQYPELIPLFEEKEVLSLVNTSFENQTSFTYSYGGNGQALQKLIWSKVLPHVKPGETIYFAPSGLLHQLAIEALPYDETHTMADMFNLVRLSSTREIVLNKANSQHSTATLYGGIQYNMTGDELLAESEQYAASNLLESRGIEDDALDRGSVKYLPGTKKEVESINQMLHDNNLSVKLYTSTTANEESFKAISGKHQNILHIATHGFYWADSTAQKKDYFSQRMLMMDDKTPTPPTIDPLNRCGLLFAGANTALSGHSADLPEGVQDGILTAKEISLLDLRDADLVVLSACETGKGEITGEGVFGLQRAFKQAGVQTIIMSLWPVNDAATQLLMTEFYRNWITNHQSKREAFRNAQNTVRSQYEEPVYWAGFIMLD